MTSPGRASRGAFTTRGGCGRRATSTGPWRFSSASTPRRQNPTRHAGCTASGSTSHGGASATAGRSYTAPTPDGRRCSPPEATARRWRCWRSSGCAGVPASSSRGAACGGSGPWREAPRDGGGQHRPGRPRRPQAPPPPRRGRGDDGRRASWQGACPPGRLPLPRGARGQLHGVRRHRALVLLRLRRGRRRAGLPPAPRGPEPARGDPAARCRATDRCGQRVARLRVGANEEAIEDFSASLEIVPDDTRALFARAVARQWVGRDDAANEDFDRHFEFATDEAAADPAGDARAGTPTRLGKNASLGGPTSSRW